MQTIYVFAAPLPRRHIAGLSIASKNLAFLEVDMDGMIPAATTVFQSPNLPSAEARRRRDATKISRKRVPVVCPDAPGTQEGRDRVGTRLIGATAELKNALPGHRNIGQVGVGNQDVWHLADIGLGRIANDTEFQKLSNSRIGRLARQCLRQGEVLGWLLSVLMFGQVYHPDFFPDV